MDALILSCGTGGGHNAAGAAIKEELIKRGYNVKFFNPYALKSNRLARVIDRAYVGLVQKAPNVFGVVYKIGNAYRKTSFSLRSIMQMKNCSNNRRLYSKKQMRHNNYATFVPGRNHHSNEKKRI